MSKSNLASWIFCLKKTAPLTKRGHRKTINQELGSDQTYQQKKHTYMMISMIQLGEDIN